MIERYRTRTERVVPGAPVMGRLTSHDYQTPAFMARLVMEKHRAKLARNKEDTH